MITIILKIIIFDDEFRALQSIITVSYTHLFGISYFDYATPISENIIKQFTVRHRLEKKDPNALKSEAKEPIIYYLDSGCPEPIKSALMEGAAWWNEAFEAAGFINAFQVEVLPDTADPLDVRYNVIQLSLIHI